METGYTKLSVAEKIHWEAKFRGIQKQSELMKFNKNNYYIPFVLVGYEFVNSKHSATCTVCASYMYLISKVHS